MTQQRKVHGWTAHMFYKARKAADSAGCLNSPSMASLLLMISGAAPLKRMASLSATSA
jgi:hypothetical protein